MWRIFRLDVVCADGVGLVGDMSCCDPNINDALVGVTNSMKTGDNRKLGVIFQRGSATSMFSILAESKILSSILVFLTKIAESSGATVIRETWNSAVAVK